MEDFNYFLKLFYQRLFYPLKFCYLKIDVFIPQAIKKNISRLLILSLVLLVILPVLLINYFSPKTSLEKSINEVSHWPLKTSNHLNLALNLWQNNQESLAFKELMIAKNMFGKSVNNQIIETENKFTQKQSLQNEAKSLEEKIQSGINSRDVYLWLSLIYYQLWESEKALSYWQKAYYLDPNNNQVLLIGKLIGELQ